MRRPEPDAFGFSCVTSVAGAALAPPLETPTSAGRSTRSPIMKPACTTCTTVPDGTDVSGTSYIACWKFGLNFSPAGSNFLTPFFSSVLSSDRSVSSTPSMNAFSAGSAVAFISAGTASSARCKLSAMSRMSRAKPVMP